MFGPELIARLGLDISTFQRRLAQVDSAIFGLKKRMASFGGAAFGKLLGVAGVVKGFASVISHAQEAREEAHKLGKAIDESTASVAELGDGFKSLWRWIKQTGGDLGVTLLAPFTKAGANIGDGLRGLTIEQMERARAISREAEANAARLSSPQAIAAAKARGEEKQRAKEVERKKSADVESDAARLVKEAGEIQARTAFDTLPVAQQITQLEKEKAAFAKQYRNETLPTITRAQALNQYARTAEHLAKLRAEQEREISAERERQLTLAEQEAERTQTKYDRRAERVLHLGEAETRAASGVQAAQEALAEAKLDPMRITLGEAASGQGFVTQTNKAKARQVQALEERAQRVFQAGGMLKDEKGRMMSAADRALELRDRAGDIRRSMGGLKASDQNPLAAAQQTLTEATSYLEEIRDALAQEVRSAK